MANRHTLAVLVENKPGVLTRVAALRPAFSIKSLAVGETEHPRSRMTIIVDADGEGATDSRPAALRGWSVLKVVEMEAERASRRLLLLEGGRRRHPRGRCCQMLSSSAPTWSTSSTTRWSSSRSGPCRNLKRCWQHWALQRSNSVSQAAWRSAAGRVRSRIN